jgi:peptide/nickel transport system substrate-binding protein
MKNLFLILTIIIIFYKPVFSDKKKDRYGDALVVASIGEPSNLIPMLASDSASHDISGLIYNGLIKYDTDLTLTGDLAESWKVSEDGLTITFHLKKDIIWEDGVPFTANDVAFGFKTIIDPKTPTAYSGDFMQVKEAVVVDKHTFKVTYEKPFAPALSTWGNMVILPKHLLENKDITKSPLTRKPLGLGPFKLIKWQSGDKLILQSNPDYFEGQPYLDNYIYKIIPDISTQFLELQTGSIDMMSLTPLQYSRQTNSIYFKENFQKYKYPSRGYTYLGFNFKHPPFQDKRVRQAISYAIDKQEIIDGILFGLGLEATGPYVPNTWAYNPNVKKYPYNLNKAKQLLNSAGWSDTDNDGILDKDGKPFEFTIITNQGNSQRLRTATIIQWRLEMAGIKVNILVLEWSTFINERIDTRLFEAVLLGWGIGLDPDQHDIWHSSKTGEKEFNFISYNNKEVDQLLEQGRRTFDKEKRKKAYFKFQEIIAEEVPYIFLYVPYALPIVHKRIKNIKAEPIGISYNLNKWYVPKALQKHTLFK